MNYRNYRSLFAAAIVAVAFASNAVGATVLFTQNSVEHYIDIKYTPSPGTEFIKWDLYVRPFNGSVLDPITSQKSFNASGGNVPVDTFANTVFSAVGAGGASYVHTEYNPGTAFPPVPADPAPTYGAVAPAPNELYWTIFDSATGDGAIPGFTPYLMARIVYSPLSRGDIGVRFFDTGHAAVGEIFKSDWFFGSGEPLPAPFPEPNAALLAGMSLAGLAYAGRPRRK